MIPTNVVFEDCTTTTLRSLLAELNNGHRGGAPWSERELVQAETLTEIIARREGGRWYFVQREDEQGHITYSETFDSAMAASDRAAERWAKEDNGFLDFPIFFVVNQDLVRCVDPIDCRP